jgi:hypothetical protein
MSDVVKRKALHGCGHCCAVLLTALLWPLSVQADLQTDVNRMLLRESASDTSRSDYEKLFTHRCETIASTIGFSGTPTGRATKYSCDQPGVGIAFYAGSDLGKHPPEKIAQYFKDELAKFGMISEVFIKPSHAHGSSMAFYINGESYLSDPARPSEAAKLIEAIAAESKLILFKRGRIKELPRGPISQ